MSKNDSDSRAFDAQCKRRDQSFAERKSKRGAIMFERRNINVAELASMPEELGDGGIPPNMGSKDQEGQQASQEGNAPFRGYPQMSPRARHKF